MGYSTLAATKIYLPENDLIHQPILFQIIEIYTYYSTLKMLSFPSLLALTVLSVNSQLMRPACFIKEHLTLSHDGLTGPGFNRDFTFTWSQRPNQIRQAALILNGFGFHNLNISVSFGAILKNSSTEGGIINMATDQTSHSLQLDFDVIATTEGCIGRIEILTKDLEPKMFKTTDRQSDEQSVEAFEIQGPSNMLIDQSYNENLRYFPFLRDFNITWPSVDPNNLIRKPHQQIRFDPSIEVVPGNKIRITIRSYDKHYNIIRSVGITMLFINVTTFEKPLHIYSRTIKTQCSRDSGGKLRPQGGRIWCYQDIRAVDPDSNVGQIDQGNCVLGLRIIKTSRPQFKETILTSTEQQRLSVNILWDFSLQVCLMQCAQGYHQPSQFGIISSHTSHFYSCCSVKDCLRCSHPNTCDVCLPGMLLENNQCTSKCQDDICLDCVEGKCQKCKQGYFLSQDKQSNWKWCLPCHSSCQTCQESPTNCQNS